MKNLLILLLSVTLTVGINAKSVDIKEGDKAPFSGVLVDYETMRKIRVDLLTKDAQTKEIESLERSLKLSQLNVNLNKEQVQILRESNDRMADRLRKTTSLSTWERVGWFALGVLGTGFAVKGAGELLR